MMTVLRMQVIGQDLLIQCRGLGELVATIQHARTDAVCRMFGGSRVSKAPPRSLFVERVRAGFLTDRVKPHMWPGSEATHAAKQLDSEGQCRGTPWMLRAPSTEG
jgi:hypothetical protein